MGIKIKNTNSNFTLNIFPTYKNTSKMSTDSGFTTIEAQISSLADGYAKVLSSIPGEDVNREGILKTPSRAAKAMIEFTSGYYNTVADIVGEGKFSTDNNDMVLIKDIKFFSLCEHHMLPFHGKMHVAYIPNGKVIGLSKIPRIVELFARRLQIQERLTQEVAEGLEEAIGAKGVAVFCYAEHCCVSMRGVRKDGSVTSTQFMTGDFLKDVELKREFFDQVNSRLY